MGERLTVLLVEDNDGDAVLVTEELDAADGAGAITVERARSLGEARELLGAVEPDCVLLDLGLPDAGPDLDALRSVLEAAPTAAVVVLTGRDDGDLAERAIAQGAQDYVVKTATPDGTALLRAIRFAADRARRLRALRASNDELSAFAHTVAHDLRSPLTVVVGMASLLATLPEMDVARRVELAGRIVDAGERLSRLVTGLLAYAELTGEDRELVELAEVVDWAAGLVRPQLREAGGTLEVGPLGTAWTNEPALRTVVLNLLSNSVKYRSGDRPLRIAVDARTEGDTIVLTVGDNGRGIPEHERARVFRLGARTDDAVDQQGSGLGLSAVQRIVRQLGGTVRVADGAGGHGVRMEVVLPRGPDV